MPNEGQLIEMRYSHRNTAILANIRDHLKIHLVIEYFYYFQRFTGVMQKKLLAFLENVVISINRRVKCSHVADEEMYRYDQLMQAACHRECYLDIAFYHNT